MSRSHSSPRDRLSFAVIAILILVFTDMIILGGYRPYAPQENYAPETDSEITAFSEVIFEMEGAPVDPDVFQDLRSAEFGLNQNILDSYAPPGRELRLLGYVGDARSDDLKAAILDAGTLPDLSPYVITREISPGANKSGKPSREKMTNRAPPPLPAAGAPVWRQNAVPATLSENKPTVVIIIDDLGINRKLSEAVINLKGPLTLAFLPYPEMSPGLAAQARRAGHELIVHMPMQPMNARLDPGEGALLTSMDAETLRTVLQDNLESFEGIVGINNHMGSKLTQDYVAMAEIMAVLRERGLLFVDSKTIHTSKASDAARDYRIPHASRDVFLDHYPDYDSVMKALKQLERIAIEKGSAIAIGHPKRDTIRALYEWLPTLEAKGIQLAPVSAVVRTPASEASLDLVAAQSAAPPPQP